MEFVGGRVTLEINDTVPEFVVLALVDSDQLGVAMESNTFEDLEDTCDPNLMRSYTPAGGSAYESHGDQEVELRVSDRSGNVESDEVFFTTNLTPPSVTVVDPPEQTVLWDEMPVRLVFDSRDDDGAAGGAVYEAVFLGACLVYDGWGYGDNDGLFSDEPLPLGDEALCRVLELCGNDGRTP